MNCWQISADIQYVMNAHQKSESMKKLCGIEDFQRK